MFLLTALATLFSLFPATFTLLATFVTAILFPLIAAIVLGILELTTNIVTSSESVALLIFSPPVLLFPVKLVRAVGTPFLQAASVVFAPALFPLQALLVCAAGILSFVLEFKALYTFLATGAILGLLAGTLVHLTTSFLSPVLGLEPTPPPVPDSDPRPVLHTQIAHPIARTPRKASLGRHPPVLRKHAPDGPDGDARLRKVKFRFDDSGFQDGAPVSPGILTD